MAIMPRLAFNASMRASRPSTTSWAARPLGTQSLFTGQSPGWLPLHPVPKLQAALSLTLRLDPHCSPRVYVRYLRSSFTSPSRCLAVMSPG